MVPLEKWLSCLEACVVSTLLDSCYFIRSQNNRQMKKENSIQSAVVFVGCAQAYSAASQKHRMHSITVQIKYTSKYTLNINTCRHSKCFDALSRSKNQDEIWFNLGWANELCMCPEIDWWLLLLHCDPLSTEKKDLIDNCLKNDNCIN